MTHQDDNVMALSSGVTIEIDAAGHWTASYNGNSYPLDAVKDFFRVWLLFEHSFENVSKRLSMISASKSAAAFPFAMLVASAFTARSAQWAEKAVGWLPFLSESERTGLRPLLREAYDNRWANQKTRQIIRRYL